MTKIKANSKLLEFITQLQYLTLIMLVAGQIVTKQSFLVGQFIYLGANLISVFRCFALDRPKSDTVKDASCLGITVGLIILTLI